MPNRIRLELIADGETRPRVRLHFPLAAATTICSLVPDGVRAKLEAQGVNLSAIFENVDQKPAGTLYQYRSDAKTVTIALE